MTFALKRLHRGTPLGVLRHRDFRLLWLGQTASVVGDAIVTVALALFVIRLTGSATDLGFVLAARGVPLVIFLLIGGVWADRLSRRRLMIASDLARFALHGLLAILIVTGTVEVWQIVVIESLFGAAEAFSRPAATGLLPQTVPEADIQSANALATTSTNVSEFAGPALATALVLGVGAGTAFAVDAVSFLLSAMLLWGVRARPRGLTVGAERRSLWQEMGDGFGEVRSRTWVWATLLAYSVTLLVVFAPWSVLGPVIAREQYGGIGIFGVVAGTFGAGMVAGSLAAIRWQPRYPMRVGTLFVLPWPLAMILFAAGATLWLVVPAMVIGGVGVALFEVWWLTALAERIPPAKLSRVTSYDWMVSLALLPLGYLLCGPLSDALGSTEVLLVGSALGLLATALGLLPRQTRMLERGERAGRATAVGPAHPDVPLP